MRAERRHIGVGDPQRQHIGRGGVGKRAEHDQRQDELAEREQDAAQAAGLQLVGEAEIGVGLLGRGAVIALAVRHALAALQRRDVTELGEIAERGVEVEHARLADEGAFADADGAEARDPARPRHSPAP